MSTYDLIILGAGPGGYVCAIRAAQLGLSVAIVEARAAAGRPRLGGTCLNVGCIPSKALLDSSERFADAGRHFAAHGIVIDPPRLDLPRLMQRKDQVVDQLVTGVSHLMKKNKVTVVAGRGELLGSGRVAVHATDGSRSELAGRSIVLAMGSVPVDLPALPIDGERVVTSDHAIAFAEVPRRLVVVGGGVIGLELGSVWARLGSEVTVVEFLPQILPFCDADIAAEAQKALTRQGLRFSLGTRVTGCQQRDGVVAVQATGADGAALEFIGERVLVAVGRRPCIETAGLDAAGVALTERRRVRVDGRFQTSVPGVYAIGDLIDGPMLAHKAEEEGVAVAELLAGTAPVIDHHLIPNVVYTHPEIASVGLTEAEAAKAGRAVKVGRFPFAANGRAKASGEHEGLVKIIADAASDRVLGGAIVGPRASDLLAEITTTMVYGGSSEDIARTCHSHPTFSEAVKEAALAVEGRALHI
jgi:dihydrolipoamide dehydrogenase